MSEKSFVYVFEERVLTIKRQAVVAPDPLEAERLLENGHYDILNVCCVDDEKVVGKPALAIYDSMDEAKGANPVGFSDWY